MGRGHIPQKHHYLQCFKLPEHPLLALAALNSMQAQAPAASGAPFVLSVDALDTGTDAYVSAAYAQACAALVQQLKAQGYAVLHLPPQDLTCSAALSTANTVFREARDLPRETGAKASTLPGKGLLEWRAMRYGNENSHDVSLKPEDWQFRESCSKVRKREVTQAPGACRASGTFHACIRRGRLLSDGSCTFYISNNRRFSGVTSWAASCWRRCKTAWA